MLKSWACIYRVPKYPNDEAVHLEEQNLYRQRSGMPLALISKQEDATSPLSQLASCPSVELLLNLPHRENRASLLRNSHPTFDVQLEMGICDCFDREKEKTRKDSLKLQEKNMKHDKIWKRSKGILGKMIMFLLTQKKTHREIRSLFARHGGSWQHLGDRGSQVSL